MAATSPAIRKLATFPVHSLTASMTRKTFSMKTPLVLSEETTREGYILVETTGTIALTKTLLFSPPAQWGSENILV
jgi:hypothetical protein